jgi:hypothetical protein
MGVEDTARVLGVECEKYRNRPRRGDDDVVAAHASALTRLEDSCDLARIAGVATPARPPPRTAIAKSVEFVGTVVREVRNVIRTPRQ